MAEIRNVVAYDTTDPNKIIVEYERESALFVAVIEIRDGLLPLWRAYRDTLATTEAPDQDLMPV